MQERNAIWISPHEHQTIETLVDECFPNLQQKRWFGRLLWRFDAWTGKQLDVYAQALPKFVPSEVIKETIKDYRTVYLAKYIAKLVLKASWDSEQLPQISRKDLQRYCITLFGSDSLVKDIDYPILLQLVGIEFEEAVIKKPQLARIVKVRQTILKQMATSLDDPVQVSNASIRLLDSTNSLGIEFQKRLNYLRDSVMVLASIQMVRQDHQAHFTAQIANDIIIKSKLMAEACLNDICKWILANLISPEKQSVRLSANFMVKLTSAPLLNGSRPSGHVAADELWASSKYMQEAKHRLAVLWTTEPEDEGFWLPVVFADPLPGAARAYAKQRADAVFVDDLESAWPFDSKWSRSEQEDSLKRISAYFDSQAFRMFLSLPTWRPQSERNCQPLGVININISEVDFGYYDRHRLLKVSKQISQLTDFFAELYYISYIANELKTANSSAYDHMSQPVQEILNRANALLQLSGGQ